MNNTRFDSLARTFRTRRAASSAIAGGLTGLLGLAQVHDADAAPCPKGKKRCGGTCIPKRGCCKTADCRPKNSGQVCRKNRCLCPGGMKRCGKRCLLKAAACPPAPDASCEPTGDTVDVVPPMRIAQVFTEPNGGRLTGASVWFRNSTTGATGTYELRLQPVDPAGVPLNVVLGVALRPSSTVSNTTMAWVDFTFPIPPKLAPGRQYALVLARLDTTDRWMTLRRTNNPCPGGRLFVTNPAGDFVFLDNLNPGVGYRTVVKP